MVVIIPDESETKVISGKRLSFRWMFILLPAVILVLCIIMVAYFYRLLPPEVAYRFEDGSPVKWISRGTIAWMIVPQFLLLFTGVTISGLTAMLGAQLMTAQNSPVRKISSIMGNMVALPQIILTFAMLDIFLYNAYQIHLMPLWVFALFVLVLGGIILIIFFIQAIRQTRRLPVKNLQE